MKSTKRALRRHHRERMIQRAMRSWAAESFEDPVERRKFSVRIHNDLKRCSCWMCGNPRRYGGGERFRDRRAAENDGDQDAGYSERLSERGHQL